MQIKYESEDGSIWPTEAAALQRDVEYATVQSALYDLLPYPNLDSGFLDGCGYIQQASGTKTRLEDILRAAGVNCRAPGYEDPYCWTKASKSSRQAVSGPLRQLLFRFLCMDEQDREWGQPYFAWNPHEAQIRPLNTARTAKRPSHR